MGERQGSRTCTHASGIPGRRTLLLQPQCLSESFQILVPDLTHILSLLALGSCVVSCIRVTVCEHDGPDSVATETYGCAPENDDGYGCARR